jgi:hypothetical protein
LWFLIILFLALKHRKITSGVNWLQNTFFFFMKYEVDPMFFAIHNGHTSNIKVMFTPKNLNPP